jgi:hypothetical protein
MKRLLMVAAFVLAAGPVTATGAGQRYIHVNGNDTGGIISWSPEAEVAMAELTSRHCGAYNKVPFITSIRRNYGDYIGFICAFPRDYDPVKAQGMWTGQPFFR